MLSMVVGACSNDDMLGVDDLDELEKLDKIENPKLNGYYPIYINSEVLHESKKDGVYTVYILNTAEEFTNAGIDGYNIPGISFKPCTTDTELANFWYEYNLNRKSANIADDFSDIDWSKQSLVIITRKYGTSGMNLNKVSGKVYRKDGGFVIALQPEILFNKGIVSLAVTHYGIAVVVDKPNLSAKDLRVHLESTEHTQHYNTEDRYEKKTESKWLKL